MVKTIDRILNAGKKVAFGLATITTLASCGDNKITGKVEIDPEHSGMIHGKVATASIENNRVVYINGLKGATVEIKGTDFETLTNFSGEYSIDNIPTRTYTLAGYLGKEFSQDQQFKADYQSVTVQPLLSGITEVPTFEIDPSSTNENKILYGKAYWNNGATYSGRKLSFHKEKVTHSPTPPYTIREPGEQLSSTITSSDGSYAFYFKDMAFSNPAYFIVSPEGKIYIEGEQRSGALPGYFDHYHMTAGIVDKDLTIKN